MGPGTIRRKNQRSNATDDLTSDQLSLTRNAISAIHAAQGHRLQIEGLYGTSPGL